MKQVNFATFPDILSYAVNQGYTWNQAHDILVKDEVPPMYELNSKEYILDEIDCYSWSDETRKIMEGFFEINGVTEFTLVND